MATKRGRFNQKEEEGTQIPSPTKRARSEGTQEEEEEEEMDDETGFSASQDIDASQLCSQAEQAALSNSKFTSLVGFFSLDAILFCKHTILACILNTQREAEVGVIERLMLVNFMCHKKLDIILSPNVNFVLGRNGSKSLLLSALLLWYMYACSCSKPHQSGNETRTEL